MSDAVPPAPAPLRKFTPRNQTPKASSSNLPPPAPHTASNNNNNNNFGNKNHSSSSTSALDTSNQNVLASATPTKNRVTDSSVAKIDQFVSQQKQNNNNANNNNGSRGNSPSGEQQHTSAPPAPQPAPQLPFDKEDVEALRKENKMLQTRVAAFFEFQQTSSTNGKSTSAIETSSSSVKGMSEAEVTAMFNLMKARIRQLELALAWECSRREEAEEKCFALMKRAVTSANNSTGGSGNHALL